MPKPIPTFVFRPNNSFSSLSWPNCSAKTIVGLGTSRFVRPIWPLFPMEKWRPYHLHSYKSGLVITYIHNRIKLWKAVFECFRVFSRAFFEISANNEHFCKFETKSRICKIANCLQKSRITPEKTRVSAPQRNSIMNVGHSFFAFSLSFRNPPC